MDAPATGQPGFRHARRSSRGRTWLGIGLWLLLTSCSAQPGEAPDVERERFHLYLLLGQSNMAGRGQLAEQDREVHPRIFALDAEGKWVPAREPLHPDPRVTESGEIYAVGPGLSFARAMAEQDVEVFVGLVPCAIGGSPIRSWRRGQPNFEAALLRARLAMRDGVLRGVLWHQGESDARARQTAARYQRQLDAVVGEWRAALGMEVPFVAGRIAEPNAGATLAQVNGAIAGLPERVPRAAVVEVADLETQGPWHFTAPAARELGRRYAASLSTLLDAGADGDGS